MAPSVHLALFSSSLWGFSSPFLYLKHVGWKARSAKLTKLDAPLLPSSFNIAEQFNADVIIVGAGTAGLVLAEELSKVSALRILVFEAGKDCSEHPDTKILQQYTANIGSDRDWQFDSVAQSGFNGRTAVQNSGKLVGGSSSINGGYFVAPSRSGVDAWKTLGNVTWSYQSLRAACLEKVQIHAPDKAICLGLGLDQWQPGSDEAAAAGPIHVTADLEEHPVTKAYFHALNDLGYPSTSAVFNDSTAHSQIIYFTQEPFSMRRSDANTAFGAKIKQRSNVMVLLDTTVTKVILEGTPPFVRAKGVKVAMSDGSFKEFFVSKEVVLSAGSINTPKLLELSGIGGPELLRSHHIPLIVENAYVGERLRNHVMAATHHELSQECPTIVPGIKAMTYMRSKDHPGLVEVLQEYTIQTGDDCAYDNVVRRIFLNPNEGSCCHFMGFFGIPNSVSFGVILGIPFSHGSTHISSPEAGDNPIVDPCFFSHPLDLELLSRHFMTTANIAFQPAMKSFFKIERNGSSLAAAASAHLETIKDYLRDNARTTYHACGTASMRPRQDGGVVDEAFKVYDTINLRIVDASVIPLLAHGNPMATVYGIAKRAANEMVKVL